MSIDRRRGATIGAAVRDQTRQTRQALQHPRPGQYRGRPVPAASGLPPTATWTNTAGYILNSGVPALILFTEVHSPPAAPSVEDYLSYEQSGANGWLENITDETLWLQVDAGCSINTTGANSGEARLIGPNGTNNEWTATPLAIFESPPMITYHAAHLAGLLCLPPDDWTGRHQLGLGVTVTGTSPSVDLAWLSVQVLATGVDSGTP